MPNDNVKIFYTSLSSLSSLSLSMSNIRNNSDNNLIKNRTKNHCLINGLKRGYSSDDRHNNNNNNNILIDKNSKIPIYYGNNNNNLITWNVHDDRHHHHHNDQHHSKQIITNLQNLKIMDLPEQVRIHQNLHNRLNHSQQHHHCCCQQLLKKQQQLLRPNKQINHSLSSTPGSSTPKITPEDENSIMSSSTMTSTTTNTTTTNKSKNGFRKKRSTNYEEYLPLCEMQKGLQKGEIVEGILRINQRNYNDAYISAPDEGLDIYINGLINRNKALNGDNVAVKFLKENEWKISFSAINTNWEEWKNDFEQLIKLNLNEIDFSKLNLNSKDMGLINMGPKKSSSSSTTTTITTETSKKLLQNEFQNLPLEIFSLDILNIIKNIKYWPKFIQRTGKVVRIVGKNHSRMFAGTLKFDDNFNNNQNNNDKYVKLISCDIRNPPIIIPIQKLPEIIIKDHLKFKNHLFLAEISDWKSDSLYPTGQIVKNFGEMGDIDAETDMMLISFSINTDDFPKEALIEYEQKFPNKDWCIPEQEIDQRKDLRNECIFTIDPETARDLDDAISYRKLSDDRIEIGVHIADVSYFIQENTMLDNIARERATSVYLVSKVIPMLPHLFCQDLCSLNPGQDKLTFSAFITLNEKGQILDKRFGRTVINSCCKLTYELAQKFIECESDDNIEQLDSSLFPLIYNQWSLLQIGQQVRRLHDIAKILRKNRKESGSIRLDKTKVTFLLDDNGLPIALSKYQTSQSNWLIEELMLLANKCVAEFLYDKFAYEGRAFLRGHPTLDKLILQEFLKSIKNICPIEFKSDNSRSMVESLEKLSEIDKNFCQMSTMFLIKAMKLAMYMCVSDEDNPSVYHHYALNFDKYTHFTSPIRRYADIIVHRLLSMALDYKSSLCTKTSEELKKIATNCNTKKYNAMLASEKSTEIYLKSYISKIVSFISKAIVFQVYDHSFDVLTITFDTINRIYLDQLSIDDAEFIRNQNDRHLKLKWKNINNNDNNDFIVDDDEKNLIQIIKSFMILDVEMTVTDRFELKTIIAHPNGKFIYNS